MAAPADNHQVQVVHRGQIIISSLMSSSLTGGRPSVLLDVRPLQGPSADRGVGVYGRGLLKGLIANGFDTNLVLLVDAGLDRPVLPSGSYRVVDTRRRHHGQLAAYEDAVVLAADIGRSGADVYHAIDFRLPGRSPRPLVVTLHDLIPWAWHRTATRGERIRYWLAPRLLRRADVILAVSRSTANDAVRIARAARSRIRVIPEAADTVFAPQPGALERVNKCHGVDGPYLLFVGALDARKDPASLMRAWQIARSEYPRLQLVIAGPPSKQAPTLMRDVINVGRVSDKDLCDLYSAASCLVFPSRYEGFGLPCLEAMACGCPVVAYRNSSLPDVVDDAGILVADGDREALGRAAIDAIKHQEQWRDAGLRQARRFSWSRTALDTISAYESLLR
jgi:glycosyltransferase involved in cell wall biosynthesis